MSGLEKIIEGILAQAGKKAGEILEAAEQTAAGIKSGGEAEREAWNRQFEAASERECLEIINLAQSSDRQNRRMKLLETRNQAIDDTIAGAKAILSGDSYRDKFMVVAQGDIIYNNSIDAVFESEIQTLRDKANEALTGGE